MKGGAAIVKRSVRIAGHATSISLEPAFWDALGEIAARRGISVAALLAAIDAERSSNLSSAARVFVLDCCRRGELSTIAAGQTAEPRAETANASAPMANECRERRNREEEDGLDRQSEPLP